MADELELKAVVADPAALRDRLAAAGARAALRGVMEDRRFDGGGRLTSADQVLRVRTYRLADGRHEVRITWKGPTRRSVEGYKLREELELGVTEGSPPPADLLRALGYEIVHAVDRYIEVFELGTATLRLEWYPRMDVLLEVEGSSAEAIEPALAMTGLPRAAFSADSLREFATRYEQRTGQRALLAVAELLGEPPVWEPW